MLKRFCRAAKAAVRKTAAVIAVVAMLAVPIGAGALAMTFLSAGPVMAQDSGGSGGVSLLTTILIAAGAALVPLIVNGVGNLWSLFVSYAAKSDSAFDDWVVHRVRDIARGVIKEEQSGTSPIPATPPTPPALK